MNLNNGKSDSNETTPPDELAANVPEVLQNNSMADPHSDTNVPNNRTMNLNNIFGLIEKLAPKIPPNQPNCIQTVPEFGGPPIRKTSDLLETLQKALMAPQAAHVPNSRPPASSDALPAVRPEVESTQYVPVQVEIDCGQNVAKMCACVNKKCHRAQRGRRKSDWHSVQDQELSTYVSFSAKGTSTTNLVESSDGPVYTTKVVERTSYPTWMDQFNVSLPANLMIDSKERFVLTVHKKTGTDRSHSRSTPNPAQDTIVGVVKINLTSLKSVTDRISDWYNIIDSYGRNNGRIKVTIVLREDPLDVDCNSLLNQTLKRKFTELDDISKRLKARLVCVTDDAHFADLDDNDEFETDLNTQPFEEDEEEDDFNWLATSQVDCLRLEVDEVERNCDTDTTPKVIDVSPIAEPELSKALQETLIHEKLDNTE